MTLRIKRLPAYLTIVAVVAALGMYGLLRPSSAEAASGCAGSLIDSKTATRSAKVIFELQVYYDASTGRNCAVALHRGVTYGKAYPTKVYIVACKETREGGSCATQSIAADPANPSNPGDISRFGNWKYLAGPVSVYAKGRCISADAEMKLDSYGPHLITTPVASHCG